MVGLSHPGHQLTPAALGCPMNRPAPITTSSRLMYNTVMNMITNVIELAVGFFLIAFLLGQLGADRYGVWVLIASVFQYRGLLSMGLNSAVNRYIPVYLARRDSGGISGIVSTSFYVFLALGSVLAAATALVSLNLGSWFSLPPELLGTARVLVLIVGFSYALAFPLQISSAILSGIQRYDIINAIELTAFLLRTVLLVVLLRRGCGLLTMGLLFGGSEVVIRAAQFIFSRRLLPEAAVCARRFNARILRESTAYGTNTLLYLMATLILFKTGNIIIGIFIDASAISHFSIAVAAVLLLSSFTETFSRALKPAISDLDARTDASRVREAALLAQKYSLLILIPACCFLVAMGRDFLGVWVGGKIADPTVLNTMASVLAIMAVANTIRLAQHTNFVVLVGRGEHRIFGRLAILSAAAFVVLAVVSLKVFRLGLVAVAWSNFVPIVLVSGIILPVYFNRRMQIRVVDTLVHVWAPALSGTLPSAAVILVWKRIAPPQSWVQILGVIATAAILTMLSGWFLGLSRPERRRLAGLVRRGLRRTEVSHGTRRQDHRLCGRYLGHVSRRPSEHPEKRQGSRGCSDCGSQHG